MSNEYQLSFTATEIDEKLGKIDNLESTVENAFNGVEHTTNRVTKINELSDDEHYPTAKAVYDAVTAGSGILGAYPSFKKIEGNTEYNEITKAVDVGTFDELKAYNGTAILRDYRHENNGAVANTDYDILKIPVQPGDVIRDMLGSYWKDPDNNASWMYAFFYNESGTRVDLAFIAYGNATPTDYTVNYLDFRENGITVPDGTAYVMLNLFGKYKRLVNGSYVDTYTLRECDIVTVNKNAELTYYDGTTELAAYVPQTGTEETYYQAEDDIRIPRYENTSGSAGAAITGVGKPTDTTKGDVGQLYMDTDTNVLYKCVEVKDDAYVWELVVGGGRYEVGKNKFNVDTITEGKFLWPSYNKAGDSPVYSDNVEHGLSDWIEVDDGDSYIFYSDGMSSALTSTFVFADENGILIADGYIVKANEPFVIPAGCVKCRFSAKLIFLQNGTAQLEKGAVRTPYESYTSTYTSNIDFTGVENYQPLVSMVDEKVNAHVPEMASEAKAGVARIWTTDNGDGTVDLHIDTTGEV